VGGVALDVEDAAAERGRRRGVADLERLDSRPAAEVLPDGPGEAEPLREVAEQPGEQAAQGKLEHGSTWE